MRTVENDSAHKYSPIRSHHWPQAQALNWLSMAGPELYTEGEKNDAENVSTTEIFTI